MTRAKPVPESVTVHIPFRLVKRGGRKEMQLPDGIRPERKVDSTLVKALARAFRWKRMLESGRFATISELAEQEKISASYLARILSLTLLAPDLVEAVLEGRPGPRFTNAALRAELPVEWEAQRRQPLDLHTAL